MERTVFLDHSQLGPGWFACRVVGNRILYEGPYKTEGEAKKIADGWRKTREERWRSKDANVSTET